MKQRFSKSALESLGKSIEFSLDYCRKLLVIGKTRMVAETFIQLIHDTYLLKTNDFLLNSAVNGALEIGIQFSEDSLEFIGHLEKSMRFEEDYLEFTSNIQADTFSKLLDQLEKVIR